MGNIYGYVRVSTREQNEDRQMIALGEMNVPQKNIYVDKQSGKDFERPKYQRLLRKLKQDDLLYIKSIDRLGRNYEEILEQWRMITKEGIEAAKKRGVQFGRPPKPVPKNFVQVYNRWIKKEISGETAAGLCGLSMSTFYRKANMRKEHQKTAE